MFDFLPFVLHGEGLLKQQRHQRLSNTQSNYLLNYHCLCSKTITRISPHEISTAYLTERHSFPLRGETRHIRCRGSSYGWLLTIDEDEYLTVHLFNPFKSAENNNEIRLPSLFSLFPDLCNYSKGDKLDMQLISIKKAAFSRRPFRPPPNDGNNDDDNLLIAVITHEDDLGFCRLGDDHWILFPTPFRPYGNEHCRLGGSDQSMGGFEDIICYKGKFHALVETGVVARLDLSQEYYPNPKLTVLDVENHPPPRHCQPATWSWFKSYLVECSGDLLQVRRGMRVQRIVYPNSYDGQVTVGFQVFKLMDKRWVEIKTIDGWSLFLGDNASFSLPAYNFPAGCIKPNCIYFTDDYGLCSPPAGAGPLDGGIFNLEDGRFEARSPVENNSVASIFPHWVQLML